MHLISLLDLARSQPGFPDDAAGWKLIVHTHSDVNLPELIYADMDAFEYFQKDQGKPNQYNCKHILSTVKISPNTALVVGAYDVLGSKPFDLNQVQPPASLKTCYDKWRALDKPGIPTRFSLTPNPILDALAKRVVIEVPHRGMKLNSLDRGVVGLREAGSIGPCPDYQDIDVSLGLLQAVFANPIANSEWKDRLSAVGGIYLLTDHKNHRLYVGKTDAKQGFWNRWGAYAAQRTGNKLVDPAFASGELQVEHTTMSILQVIPRGSANERQIEALEHRWMKRLQSRETGYNSTTSKSGS